MLNTVVLILQGHRCFDFIQNYIFLIIHSLASHIARSTTSSTSNLTELAAVQRPAHAQRFDGALAI